MTNDTDDINLNADLTFDSDEATRLMRGEIAITHEHLYFAWGDIRDVYIARECRDDDVHLFHLIQCNPLDDNDLELATCPPRLAIRHNSQLDLFDADGTIVPTRWDVRSLYPFGPKQLEWYTLPDHNRLVEA